MGWQAGGLRLVYEMEWSLCAGREVLRLTWKWVGEADCIVCTVQAARPRLVSCWPLQSTVSDKQRASRPYACLLLYKIYIYLQIQAYTGVQEWTMMFTCQNIFWKVHLCIVYTGDNTKETTSKYVQPVPANASLLVCLFASTIADKFECSFIFSHIFSGLPGFLRLSLVFYASCAFFCQLACLFVCCPRPQVADKWEASRPQMLVYSCPEGQK